MGNYKKDSGFGDKKKYRGERTYKGAGKSQGVHEMHKAKCSECGKTCEVPFKPTGRTPVFCSRCFSNTEKGQGSDRNKNGRPGQNHSEPSNEQIETINTKLDRILKILEADKSFESLSFDQGSPSEMMDEEVVVKKNKKKAFAKSLKSKKKKK